MGGMEGRDLSERIHVVSAAGVCILYSSFYFFFIGFKAKMKALEDEINGIDLNQIRHESRVLAGVEGILDSYTFR